MAYQFVSSIVLEKGYNKKWKEYDVSTISVNELFHSFNSVFLQLKEPVTETTGYVNLNFFEESYKTYSNSLLSLLVSLSDSTIPLEPVRPEVTNVKHVIYFDAIRHRFKVDPCIIGISDTENYPRADLTDLKVRKNIDNAILRTLHTHTIPIVNGYLHRTDFSSTFNEVYVLGGGKTYYKTNMNTLGFLDFRALGSVTKLPITENMITGDVGTNLYQKLYINLPENLNLSRKSLLLSLGGYLVLPKNDVLRRVDSNSLELFICNTPYLERIAESWHAIDLSSLGSYDFSYYSNVAFNSEQIINDVTIRRYLQLSQSFVIIVDIDRIVFEKAFIRYCNMPGMFTTVNDPIYPLIVNYGKFGCYWKSFEDGIWSVNVRDSFHRKYFMSEDILKTPRLYTDKQVPFRDNYHSSGYFLDIIGYNVL